MLTVAEYGIGMYVNLYVTIPRSDHGHGLGTAISNGPGGEPCSHVRLTMQEPSRARHGEGHAWQSGSDLADRDHMDRVVEPVVAAPGQPAGLPAARGYLDGGGAVVRSEVIPVREAGT